MPDLIPVDHDPFAGDGGSPAPPTNGIPPVNYADTSQADQGLMDTLSRLANINTQRFAMPQQQPQQPQQPQLTQEGYPYWQADQGQPGMPPASSLQPQQPAPIYDQPAGPQTPFRDTRGAYAQELANPLVRDRLLSFMMAEVGTQGPQAQQAFLESVLNRAAARGQSIMRTLAADYYPSETLTRAAQYRAGGMNPAQYDPMMGEVMSGSNVGNYTTGNASRDPRTGRDVGFAGGPQTAKFVGERYGVEGPDLGWARSVGYEGGAGAPDDSDPWERAAYRQANAVRPRGGRQEGLATRLLERYLPHVAQGMVDWAATPGRAYKEGLSPEEEANWGAGTAMGMLGMGATRAASPMGAPGELGIFGGKLSQTADHAALARAQQMETAGIPPAKIHQDTGWFKGADGQWRYEINDQGAALVPGAPRSGPLEQKLKHPELYEAYPQLRETPATIEGGANRGEWTPAATGRPGYMNVTGATPEKQASIALHEAQHAVQEIEGFSPGTSTQGVGAQFTPEGLAKYLVETAQQEGVDLAAMNPAQREGYARNVIHSVYRQAMGETESRNTQFRQKMSPEERRAQPPWHTQDVPTEYQYHAGPGAPAAYEPVPVEHDPFAFDTHPGLISTRFPTAVRAKEKPLEQRLGIDTDAMRMDPDAFKRNVFLVRRYPNLTREEVKGPPDQVADNFINHVKDNLLWLHDHVPPEIRDRSKLWYEGANKIIKQRAEETGLPETSVAAVYAAMSPQKDWFQNVSLGDRVMSVYLNHGDQKFTPRMLTTGKEIFGKPQYADLFKALQSRSLNELTDPVEKAMWIRIFDQAHQSPAYKLVQPEGTFGDVVKTNSGAPVKVAWGSNVEIAKAVQAIEAKGDVNTISPLLGQRHKVRSFYNNMLHPNAPFGDVTIDTHAVAAGLLRPLSGNSVEVSHNFGNWPGAGIPATRSSSITGTDGLYGMYADAYRKAAAERGILPREMQSITWEAVRGLFPERFKAQPKNVAAINAMWKNYRNGSITLDQVREAVNGYAGGIRKPDWAE